MRITKTYGRAGLNATEKLNNSGISQQLTANQHLTDFIRAGADFIKLGVAQ
jgi:hypothetical protein